VPYFEASSTNAKVARHLLNREHPVIGWKSYSRRILMKNKIWMLSIKIQNILKGEEGQDLIEYALVVALIAFAAVGAMGTLASDINQAFIGIGSKLTNATT
jgi:pilus assembly protein Flp/PilA